MSDFKAKFTKFPLGLAPDPAGGAYSAPASPLAVFKGPTSTGKARKEGGEGIAGGKRREKRGKGKGWKGSGQPQIF